MGDSSVRDKKHKAVPPPAGGVGAAPVIRIPTWITVSSLKSVVHFQRDGGLQAPPKSQAVVQNDIESAFRSRIWVHANKLMIWTLHKHRLAVFHAVLDPRAHYAEAENPPAPLVQDPFRPHQTALAAVHHVDAYQPAVHLPVGGTHKPAPCRICIPFYTGGSICHCLGACCHVKPCCGIHTSITCAVSPRWTSDYVTVGLLAHDLLMHALSHIGHCFKASDIMFPEIASTLRPRSCACGAVEAVPCAQDQALAPVRRHGKTLTACFYSITA